MELNLFNQWLVAIGYLLGSSFPRVMLGVYIRFQSLNRISGREKVVGERMSYIFKRLMLNEK